MYVPSLEEFKELAKYSNLIPVYVEINADLETPVTAYMKVANKPNSFLLESVEGGEKIARFSFIGTDPSQVIKTGNNELIQNSDPLSILEETLSKYKLGSVPGLPRFHGGAVGYISYDTISYFEPSVKKPSHDDLQMPESVFMITNTLLVFDHIKQKILVISHAEVEDDIEKSYLKAKDKIEETLKKLEQPLTSKPSYSQEIEKNPSSNLEFNFESNFTREEYHEIVTKCKEYIVNGDIIQVVPSQRLSRPTNASDLSIYRALRSTNPSPYMYLINLGDFQIIGASPELLVRVEDNKITYLPLAGTRRRGIDEIEDEKLAEELLSDEKERAEHIMLVDLGRNDVGKVSTKGSVEVSDLMRIVKYSQVMHIESEVIGELHSDYTVYDALRSCMPAGTLSGAPKIRAMQIIGEMENSTRGCYGGAVGYVSFSGNMDTAIPIRTMILKDGVGYIQAGGGIVYDSDPESEYLETLQKARALLRAIEIAENY